MNNDVQQIWEAYRDPRLARRHAHLLLQQELQAIQTLMALPNYHEVYDQVVQQFHIGRVEEIKQQIGE